MSDIITGWLYAQIKNEGVLSVIRYINRHAMMRKHKRHLKKKYGYGLYNGYRTNLRLHEDECRQNSKDWPNARNGGYEYWQTYYLTGPRQYAKSCTNRAIRAYYRDILRTLAEDELEDVQALCGSDYEKMYDYDWTIW